MNPEVQPIDTTARQPEVARSSQAATDAPRGLEASAANGADSLAQQTNSDAANGDSLAQRTNSDAEPALFDGADAAGLTARWREIQSAFVDEPKSAIEKADALVQDLIGRLNNTFAAQRSELESQWARGSDVSTEDLRQTLQRYRSFFDRLLAA